MTEKQKYLLKLFREVDEICREHNLRYVLAGGSLIGALRHEGFVPWDDDVDLYMPRSDWEKFIEICKTELPPDREIQREHPSSGRGIFVYDGIMRRSVTRYKYYGCREYGDFYARAMYRYAQKELREWKPDLIVPVPVHRSKERQRGFNQAAYLAEKLGHYTGISTDVNIVQKVLKTKSQKKLNALQRRKNLEKAFCVTGDVRGKNILVIDDVYTTGSTIDAMAGCLKRKGAGNVYFLTVCIGRR